MAETTELPEQPAAVSDCDHHWIGYLKGGEPLSVRICSLCGEPDWDDLRRQVEELSQPRQHGTIEQLVRDAERQHVDPDALPPGTTVGDVLSGGWVQQPAPPRDIVDSPGHD